ncbi:twin-arginine translocase subunit TatC [Microlunatus sp. Y2014]|uniref:twin-arginine translocase subunit TatC n=1 Tax=Microlunatus sp. Y2014 TaxID=3418488 RepID=UPI003DA76E45
MSLYDHLRELRYRVLFAGVAVIVGMAVSAIFYNQLYGVLKWPLDVAIADLAVTHPSLELQPTNNDVTSPFIIMMKVIAISGLVFTAPVWLYQLWAFIMPGLLANEKKWARIFVGCATPLFLAGVATGYLLMPKAVGVLIGFTPDDQGILNLLTMENFLSFLIRVMLVFGVSYLIPLLMLMLNFLGIITSKHMKKFRPFIIFGAFAFAAVATPSTDPFSMIALALPLTILMMITEQIAKWNEKRKGKLSDDPLARDKVLQDMLAADEAAKLEAEQTDAPALDSADKK